MDLKIFHLICSKSPQHWKGIIANYNLNQNMFLNLCFSGFFFRWLLRISVGLLPKLLSYPIYNILVNLEQLISLTSQAHLRWRPSNSINKYPPREVAHSLADMIHSVSLCCHLLLCQRQFKVKQSLPNCHGF